MKKFRTAVFEGNHWNFMKAGRFIGLRLLNNFKDLLLYALIVFRNFVNIYNFNPNFAQDLHLCSSNSPARHVPDCGIIYQMVFFWNDSYIHNIVQIVSQFSNISMKKSSVQNDVSSFLHVIFIDRRFHLYII